MDLNIRLRRLRQSEALRRLVRQTHLSVDNLVMPLFVCPGKNVRDPIGSMPGHFKLSIDGLIKEAKELYNLGICAILLFGLPESKDEYASQAYAKDGVVQQAVKRLKDALPDIAIITDVCLCAYTSHGHCGVVKTHNSKLITHNYIIDNDATLELLAKVALSHAEAGVSMVAPSDMMDGRIKAIRMTLDKGGFENLPIMSYSAKYASSFYGPFREAAESAPRFGDRKSYQMDPANSDEALREIRLDIEEGADIVMVKPALAYLDVIWRAKQEFDIPLAAYSVSGEFSLVKTAGKLKWLDENSVMMECLTGIKRSGADIIITYWAKEAACILQG